MALYPVPWFTTGGVEGEGGAENYGELARADAFIGSKGKTGIIDPDDFEVTALPTPGAAVRITKGTGVIRSTYPGVVGQSYVVQERDYTDVPVAATGSSGTAKKYVYLLIEDTQFTGQPPVSVEDGPYNSYHVTTTLPQFQPYLLLAEINQPMSTATITNAMITDRRKVTEPIVGTATYGRPRLSADDDPRQNYCNALWDHGTDGKWFGELFPGGWGSPNMAEIDVPDDATHFGYTATWGTVYQASNKNVRGLYWIEYGDEYKGNGWGDGRNLEFVSQTQGFNTTGTPGVYSTNWILIGTLPIPKKLRGKTIQFAFKAGRTAGSDTDGVFMNSQSSMGLDIKFSKQPIRANTI